MIKWESNLYTDCDTSGKYMSSNNDKSNSEYINEALSELIRHIESTNDDKYSDEYNPLQPIEFAMAQEDYRQYAIGFNIGNAIKYLCRYISLKGNKTGQVECLNKAAHFIMIERARMLKENESNNNN